MADYNIEAPPGRQEVIITQIIHSPREVVFRTLTDPMMIPRWWGPERFTTSVNKMSPVPGGTWRYVQTDEKGMEYAFHGVYHDVVIPKRLVYTSEYEGMPGHIALYIEDLTQLAAETRIITRVIFQSVEDRDQLLQQGMDEGVREMTRRLNQLLAKERAHNQERKVPIMEQMKNNGGCISVSRIFDAPREEVWQRWTDPSQYMCWWGPKDYTAPYAKFDLRPGGSYLTCMREPGGRELWDTGKFEEIDELNRIVYTATWADEHGNVVPPSHYGMGGDQPIEMAVQVNLEDIGGKTRLTLEHCGFSGEDDLDQARSGWLESLDKLADCLS